MYVYEYVYVPFQQSLFPSPQNSKLNVYARVLKILIQFITLSLNNNLKEVVYLHSIIHAYKFLQLQNCSNTKRLIEWFFTFYFLFIRFSFLWQLLLLLLLSWWWWWWWCCRSDFHFGKKKKCKTFVYLREKKSIEKRIRFAFIYFFHLYNQIDLIFLFFLGFQIFFFFFAFRSHSLYGLRSALKIAAIGFHFFSFTFLFFFCISPFLSTYFHIVDHLCGKSLLFRKMAG